jgi:putative flippase GtrA
MGGLFQRAVKFGLTGVLTTALAYTSFMLLLKVMHYVPAMTITWVLSLSVGFVINRRFTFGIQGAQRRGRELALYLVGSGLQLALAMVCYGALTERGGLAPTPAFFVNLVVTTAFSFLFMNLVAFRRRPEA